MTRQEQMYSVVDQYHKSGLSIRAFSQQQGINPHTLCYWIRKKRKSAKQPKIHSGFIPISTTPSFSPSAGILEIVYPTGVKIRICSTDISAIRTLIHLS